jgi:hypothetical protein
MSVRVAYAWSGWWGSPTAVVRGEPPETHEVRRNENVKKAVDLAIAIAGKPVGFGAGRQVGGGVIALSLTGVSGLSVNADYLQWVEKEVSPDDWQQVTTKGGALPMVVGRKDGEPVAVIGLMVDPA